MVHLPSTHVLAPFPSLFSLVHLSPRNKLVAKMLFTAYNLVHRFILQKRSCLVRDENHNGDEMLLLVLVLVEILVSPASRSLEGFCRTIDKHFFYDHRLESR
jgi:hypothetical protein